jgi:hypothetical protein
VPPSAPERATPFKEVVIVSLSLFTLRANFLTILPRLECVGRRYFRHVRCAHRREDAICEMVAIAWKWSIRMIRRGKDPSRFPSALATFAARAVRSGRRLCGQEKARDALSSLAQRRHSFLVGCFPEASTLSGNPLEEALHDNTRTPVPEQVSFRLDFPAWVLTLCERDQRLLEDLMMGERTQDVARKHGLSAARVSQLRREFLEDWEEFHGIDE